MTEAELAFIEYELALADTEQGQINLDQIKRNIGEVIMGAQDDTQRI